MEYYGVCLCLGVATSKLEGSSLLVYCELKRAPLNRFFYFLSATIFNLEKI
jgi:hypothetical protein